MDKRRSAALVTVTGLFLLCMASCDIGAGDKGSGVDAVAYPTESIDTSYKITEVKTFTDKDDFGDYLLKTFGTDSAKWPVDVYNNYVAICVALGSSNPVTVTAQTFQRVNGVVFFEYCSWYEPNSSLTISLSSVNETSVSESVSKSVTANLGYDSTSISGSISQETTKTVTTANGIEVANSYDLSKYNQDRLYKVVLVGVYSCVEYTFKGVFNSTPFTYVGEGIQIDQSSLAVKLVHD